MDLKYSIRSLFKNPGFTILAVVVLALGIGANSAIFTVINGVILRPLPYNQPERIVSVANLWKKTNTRSMNISAPDFHDWRAQNTVFQSIAYYSGGESSVMAGSQPDYAVTQLVSSGFFDAMGASPSLGRIFNGEEEKKGGPLSAVISYGFWQRNFAGNNNAIGKTVKAEDRVFTIVGIMPQGFSYPAKTDVWMPASVFEENTHRTGHNYRAVARLKHGVSVEEAQTQMTGIAARIEQQYPSENTDKSVSVLRLQDQLVASIRQTLFYLLGAVALVLLIACANVANLLLARASGRTREIAIRAALGASRARVIRQLVTESLVLAVLAGAAGILVAIWGKDVLLGLAPKNLARLDEIHIDGWVLAFTFVVALLSSLLFGVAPALSASRLDLNESLKQGGTRTVVGGGSGVLRQSLVVVEIALSIVLVAGAGLLIKSFAALTTAELGFRPEHILVMRTNVPSNGLESAKRATLFYRELLTRLTTLPNASSVSASTAIPGAPSSNGAYQIEGGPSVAEQTMAKAPQAVYTAVTPNYFKTLGVRLVQGRDFDDRDMWEAQPVAVINEALAKQSFKDVNPIGRQILCGYDRLDWMTIVGVVSDIRQYGPATKPYPELYMPYLQHPRPSTRLNVMIRTASDASALGETLRRKVRELNSEVPAKFTTVEETLSDTVSVPRFRTTLLGVFAGLALCLAMVGIYGVMAYLVSQRTAEIGVRMALGASQSEVLGMILKQGAKLAAIGLVVGLAASFAVNRTIQSFLFEVKAGDPLTYVAVAAVMVAAVMAACLVPAWRASRLDPLVALRQE